LAPPCGLTTRQPFTASATPVVRVSISTLQPTHLTLATLLLLVHQLVPHVKPGSPGRVSQL
jgi:hypothetical protein